MRSPPEAYAKKSLTVLPFPPLTSSKPSELLKQRKKQRRFQKQTRQDQIQSTLHDNLSILHANRLLFLLLSTDLKFPPQSLIRQMMITLWKTSQCCKSMLVIEIKCLKKNKDNNHNPEGDGPVVRSKVPLLFG